MLLQYELRIIPYIYLIFKLYTYGKVTGREKGNEKETRENRQRKKSCETGEEKEPVRISL